MTKGKIRKRAHNSKDLAGQVFGRLTVLRLSKDQYQYDTNVLFWECQCECKKRVTVRSNNLVRKNGGTKSCGCLSGEHNRKKSA